jgi:D-alanine-D-alanine ligase
VGGDAFTQLVCQDKTLAKVLARRHGIAAADSILLEQGSSENQFHGIARLKLPLVVKPNAEGGSIGISEENLVRTTEDATQLARTLLQSFPTVMVEEFVSGKEVSIILAGNSKRIVVDEVIELEVLGAKIDLSDTLFGFEFKNFDPYEVRHRRAPEMVSEETRAAARSLFRSLGKVEVLRIDGRVNENGFILIELSPDAHLGSVCMVASAFQFSGLTYPQMLETLLLNAELE